MDVLKDVDNTIARKKIGDSHSIIQLVLHMVSWRTFVTRRLLGDATFELSDEDNFPPATNWTSELEKLEASQSELLKAIETITSDQLSTQVASRKYDFMCCCTELSITTSITSSKYCSSKSMFTNIR